MSDSTSSFVTNPLSRRVFSATALRPPRYRKRPSKNPNRALDLPKHCFSPSQHPPVPEAVRLCRHRRRGAPGRLCRRNRAHTHARTGARVGESPQEGSGPRSRHRKAGTRGSVCGRAPMEAGAVRAPRGRMEPLAQEAAPGRVALTGDGLCGACVAEGGLLWFSLISGKYQLISG